MKKFHNPFYSWQSFIRYAILFIVGFIGQGTFGQGGGTLSDVKAANHYIDGPMGIQVNAITGNLFYSRNDIRLPGIGLPLDVTFYYNTVISKNDLGFGVGWSWSMNIYYEYDPGNPANIVIHRGHERRDWFKFISGTFHAPALITDTLYEYTPGKYILQQSNGTKYYFDDAVNKQVSKVTDLNGNNILFTYSSGKIASISNSAGFSLTFTWTGIHLTKIADNSTPAPREWNYTYGGPLDNLTKVEDPEGYLTTYTYQAYRLSTITDANGNTTEVNYDLGNNHVTNIDWPLSMRGMYFFHDSALKQTRLMDLIVGSTRNTIYQYDNDNRLIKETNPMGGIKEYTYDANDYLASEKDPKGNTRLYTYDSKGRTLTKKDPLDQIETYTYDGGCGCGKPKTYTDKKGNVTQYQYDANGNKILTTYPDGKTEQYTYHANGLLATHTDPNGHITQYTYNGSGYLTLVTLPIGAITMTYDSRGNMLTQTDPLGHTTTYTYDKLNRRLTATDALGHTTTMTYDGVGNLQTITDANGKLTQYQYDALNRMTQYQKPLGTNTYTYDGVGNMTSMTNPLGKTTNNTYDALNRLKTETDPAGNLTSYSYDPNGNVLTKTQPNGEVISYAFDALDRMISRSYTGNTENYSYDANDNLVAGNNNQISLSYTYDTRDRLMTKTIDTWGKTITYTYDNTGNVAIMKDADNGTTNYTYDAMDRLTNLQNPFAETTTFNYDLAGRKTKTTHANGSYADYTYDNANRLLSLQNKKSGGSIISSFTYTMDNVGNRTTMTDNTGINNYSYDNIYQLTSAQYSDGHQDDFSYDNWGNRKQWTHDLTQVTDFTHDVVDRMKKVGTDSIVYDANGNMTQIIKGTDTTRYNYDGANHITGVVFPTGKTIQMVYGPDQLRYVLSDTNNLQTRFVYDGINAIMELDNSNTTTARLTATQEMNEWISSRKGSNRYFLHKDGSNSVTEITDELQSVRKIYRYDAYGRSVKDSGDLNYNLRYAGYRSDPQSGLYHNLFRDYQPSLGRFTQIDPAGQINDLNLFAYVGNNPINYIDPLGLSWLSTAWNWLSKPLRGSVSRGNAIGTALNILSTHIKIPCDTCSRSKCITCCKQNLAIQLGLGIGGTVIGAIGTGGAGAALAAITGAVAFYDAWKEYNSCLGQCAKNPKP